MRYCDYEYYKNEFKGLMPEALFNKLSIIASAKIKSNTFNRIIDTNIPVEVKNCMCAICDELEGLNKSKGKTSESVGSWSVSYDKEEDKKAIYGIMKDFLSAELLYRGV